MISGIKLQHLPLVGNWIDAHFPALVLLDGLGVNFYFGGTSLLIVVGVAMDTVNQVEAQLIMRHYEGFTPRAGRIRGRRSVLACSKFVNGQLTASFRCNDQALPDSVRAPRFGKGTQAKLLQSDLRAGAYLHRRHAARARSQRGTTWDRKLTQIMQTGNAGAGRNGQSPGRRTDRPSRIASRVSSWTDIRGR